MSNRVTLEQMRQMPLSEVAALPLEQIKMLMDDIDELEGQIKSAKSWMQGALHIRFGDTAATLRRDAGKDTGTVKLQEDEFTITADLPKKVDWNQDELAKVEASLADMGEDPAEYIKVERKVSETAYNAWPSSLSKLFEPARTVRSGEPKYKIEPAKKARRAA